jgi:glutamyl-Q tRNA(Asp) synthetase
VLIVKRWLKSKKSNFKANPLGATYVGRFAPSPSGPLHLGSLYIAVASYLAAKSKSGTWIVRLEDIDEPRCQVGADKLIIDTLSAHGLQSDIPIIYQAQRKSLYNDYLTLLESNNKVYPCVCSRANIKLRSAFYQGQCRQQTVCKTEPFALRFKNSFSPSLHKPVTSINNEDIIIKRKDGLFAYNFVVVCDDIDQGVTEVVRGNDLADTQHIQTVLRNQFSQRALSFLHLPVLVSAPGQKLSKQNHAPAVDNERAKDNLLTVFSLLGIKLTHKAQELTISQLLHAATLAWPTRIINNQHEIIVR